MQATFLFISLTSTQPQVPDVVHATLPPAVLISGLNCESPVMALWSCEACQLCKVRGPQKREGGRHLFDFSQKLASPKSQAELFHLAIKLNLELNLYGYLGVVLFLEKTKLLLSLNEKELDSCVRSFQRGVRIWLVNADWTPVVCRAPPGCSLAA